MPPSRSPTKSSFIQAKFVQADSLKYLDWKILTAKNVTFEIGTIKCGDDSSPLVAKIQKGMVVELMLSKESGCEDCNKSGITLTNENLKQIHKKMKSAKLPIITLPIPLVSKERMMAQNQGPIIIDMDPIIVITIGTFCVFIYSRILRIHCVICKGGKLSCIRGLKKDQYPIIDVFATPWFVSTGDYYTC